MACVPIHDDRRNVKAEREKVFVSVRSRVGNLDGVKLRKCSGNKSLRSGFVPVGICPILAGKNDVKSALTSGGLAATLRALRFQEISMSTFMAKQEEQAPRWFIIDANGKVLGKVAERAANILRGKLKPQFTPHVDTGDFVVVINAKGVVLTGRKETAKEYMTYSQYPGNEKRETVAAVRVRRPEHLVEHAVKGMIPRNRLGRRMITKLKVYAGAEHPHAAQKPEPVKL
jgi:large subunit ribosomal protein L13